MTATSRPGSAWVVIASYAIETGRPHPLAAVRG